MMRYVILASLAGIVWAVGVSVPVNADLDADSDQLFRQGASGVSGSTEASDRFGFALAVGDFDGDGHEDLAIGVLGEDNGAGGVNVLYGDSVGLSAAGHQFWNQDSAGITGEPEENDHFGWALAAGDFDGDGYDDLAIGVRDEDYIASDDGGVHVLYGGAGGLTATGSQFWSQDSAGIAGEPEENDQFGWALTAGDFDGDGYDDLVIGVPREDYLTASNDGGVHVLYGGAGGLTATGSQFWSQDSAGVVGDPELGDQFGWALTAGDFDGDGYDDLAIGVPWEDYVTASNDGGVHVLYGGAGGLTAIGSQFWSQDSAGVDGESEENDQFGQAVAAGDFDGDGHEDLAIGVHGENDLSGAVNVLYGDSVGLSATGNQFWSQDSAGVVGVPEFGDLLGWTLTAGDLDGDGYDDLAVGVPGEDFQTPTDDGGVHVLYGGPSGVSAAGNQFWSQDSPGMDLSPAEEGDQFGNCLVAGDFNGNGARDLAVGVPFEDWNLFANSGIVQVLYDSSVIFANGFEPDDTSVWSAMVP